MNFETALLTGLVVGPLLYIGVTLFRETAQSYAAFHYAARAIRPSDFIDSTIMYAFQVAVISLFATWGFVNGLWAMLVPVFWGVGYFIIVLLVWNGKLDQIILGRLIGTIHHFISQQNKYRYVAVIGAAITLFGIAGPAMFEANFVAELANASLQGKTGSGQFILFFICFIAVSAIYMVYSGYVSVVRTDKIQLAIGFAGINIVLAILLYILSLKNYSAALFISWICLGFSFVIFVVKFLADRKLGQIDAISFISTGIAFLSYLVAMLAFPDKAGSQPSLTFGGFLAENFREKFTLASIISLAIANGLYQLVDVGHWQRLLSVQIDQADLPAARKTLIIATTSVGIYSPLTWAVTVMFGITLRYLLPDGEPWSIVTNLMKFFAESGMVGVILAFLFITALSAIMYSTLDSLVSCVAFTVHNDLLIPFSDRLQSVGWARIITLILLVAMGYYYLIMKGVAGEHFDAILYLSWSFQISLVPAVVSTFLRPSVGPVIATSMIIGCIAATWPMLQDKPAEVFQYSPALALAASSVAFLLLEIIRTKRERTV